MSTHAIIGAGPVGSAVAILLAESGHEVRVITRSGSGPDHPGIRRIGADGTDTAALRAATAGADVVFNCANPRYHRWATDWPPLAASILAAAESAGAGLVITGNLYGYGPVDRPMRPADPLAATSSRGRVRAAMWADALAAHRAGRVRVTEARASDFFGPDVSESGGLIQRVLPAVLGGKRARVVGDPDAAHTYTYVPDVARTMIALAADDRAWGRAWHVPSPTTGTTRQFLAALAAAAGAPAPRVSSVPGWVVGALGAVMPPMRGMDEQLYQFERPFELDWSETTATFGIDATPLAEAAAATVAAARPLLVTG